MKADRGCYIGVPEVFSLGHCCAFIARRDAVAQALKTIRGVKPNG